MTPFGPRFRSAPYRTPRTGRRWHGRRIGRLSTTCELARGTRYASAPVEDAALSRKSFVVHLIADGANKEREVQGPFNW